jgi:hypothetical protein
MPVGSCPEPTSNVVKSTQPESLILAQSERWRQALYMQVERPFGGVADG